MKQKKLLSLTLSQLELLFQRQFPVLSAAALSSGDAVLFRQDFVDYVNTLPPSEARQALLAVARGEGTTIHEMSRDEDISLETIGLLYRMLRHQWETDEKTDLYLDIYSLLCLARRKSPQIPDRRKIRKLTSRWPSGLDKDVIAVRQANKERMLHLLVQRVEARPGKRFHFEEEMSYAQKLETVSRWWDDSRFQLAMALKTPKEINAFLGGTLSQETLYLMQAGKKKGMPFFATPYYLSLLDVGGTAYDDTAIRSYLFYSPDLVESFGNIHAWEREDAVEAGKPNAAGWLVPDGKNIHRRYPDVAILIPDTMGRACGGLCASCQRMYDFQSKRLNFEFEQLMPNEAWPKKLSRLMKYFEEDTQIRDILITGGDALMSQNKTLRGILDAVYAMAARKHKANASRPDGEKYAELQRVRLGSRLPAYLPMRIDDSLVEILRDFKEKASTVGVLQFIVQTHFQTPLEVTPEAREAVRKILSAGWLVDNQLVFNVAASRRGHSVRLRQVLGSIGVIGYYTFTVKGFEENHAVFTPNARSVQEREEEKIYGVLPSHEQDILGASLTCGNDAAAVLHKFLKHHKMSFVATDRNVLNLPAIGKSMTYTLAGYTRDGRRILLFDHDATRPHSPIIASLGKVYIVENKSIAEYLRQLEALRESPEDYASVWGYVRSRTEERFCLYRYPDFPFGTTDHVSNLTPDFQQ